MKLIRIGDLITISNEKNIKDLELPFYGINRNKEFMPTVANVNNVNRKGYKIVKKGKFVFSGMQTGRDKCIRIGLYDLDFDAIISPAYTTFEVTSKEIIPEFLFMYFKSSEKDRYGAFLSDGSIRSNLDWDVFCNMKIPVPSIEIQNKYVSIYKSMQGNLKVYQSKLDDLKLVCDAYIEELRKKEKPEEIGEYITPTNYRNADLSIKFVQGVENTHKFISTRAKMNGIDLKNYKIVENDDFAYNPARINIGSIALRKGEKCVISPMYETFRVKDKNKLLPEYLMLWLSRDEFKHYTYFYSFGSVRDTFDMSLMKEVKIPIPNITIQRDIAKIYSEYINRIQIINEIKKVYEKICPILVKGAIQEGEKEKNE